MIKEKVCPLILIRRDSDTSECLGAECAWWISDYDSCGQKTGQCALFVIAVELRNE